MRVLQIDRLRVTLTEAQFVEADISLMSAMMVPLAVPSAQLLATCYAAG